MTRVELVLTEVPIGSLKLDETSPRIQHELMSRDGGLSNRGVGVRAALQMQV
jgi:hypothetical protein